MVPGWFGEPIYWNEIPLRFSKSAIDEMNLFRLDPIIVSDMLNNSFDCPKKKRFDYSDKEICSNRDNKRFRIILCMDYTYDIKQNAWLVKHVKPDS